MKLGEKQELFAHLVPKLLRTAELYGYAVRIGEVYRFPQMAEWNSKHCRVCKKEKKGHKSTTHPFKGVGIVNSLHCKKLAIDIILFQDGKPFWDTEEYRRLGMYWEGLDTLCRWGGRFNDGGHFSITHGGTR